MNKSQSTPNLTSGQETNGTTGRKKIVRRKLNCGPVQGELPSLPKMSTVGSCTGFTAVAGTRLAFPHKSKVKQFSVKPHFGSSEYRQKYRGAPMCHSSMDKKPLSIYDPLADRSRNQIPDPKIHK